jgi:chromosome segregation ATPase
MSGSNNAWFGMAPRPSTPTRSLYSSTSAPSSPLGLPRIDRAPSQDALERSIHNDSGHGKSTLQIIKELKASNAKLSAKTADMEADFMNQLNEMTLQFNDKEDALKQSLEAKEQQFSAMDARVSSTETRIRERDGQLVKVKEETTFQRHTIADLKNQLYQLQHEIEDAEYDKRDEVDKWSLEKKEMEREITSLKEQLQSQLTEGQQVMQSWKQLEGAKAELETTKKQLQEQQRSLAKVENDKKRTEKERATTEAELKAKLEAAATEMAELKAHSQSEHQYRRDEAEDLRVLNESLREDAERLKNELDDADKDLDEREEGLIMKGEQITELTTELERVSTELTHFKKQVASSSDEQVGQLVKQLDEAKKQAEELRVELKSASEKHAKQIHTLQQEVQTLIADRDDIESKLEGAEETREKARRDLEQGLNLRTQDEGRSEQRLREIVANAAKERADLETEFEARLANVEQAYQKKITQLAANTRDPEELHALKNESKQKALEIERLTSQLREAEATASTSRASTNEFQSLREKVRTLEAKKVSADRAKKQLREAQIALVALDDEKCLSDQKHLNKIAVLESQKLELNRELRAQILQKDAELSQLRDLGSSARVSEYVVEIEKLNAELKDKEAMLEMSKSRSALNIKGGNVDEALRKELIAAKRAEEQLQAALSAARQEQANQHKKLREKLEDRDTTISALVKSSVSQEQKVASMKEEVMVLKGRLDRNVSTSSSHEMEAVRKAREAEFVDEVEDLRSALEDSKDIEKRLFHDVSTLERKLVEVETENKRMKIQVSPKALQRGVPTSSENQEKLQERDSAIATLVKQSMNLEEQVTELKNENMTLRVEKQGLSSGIKNQTGPSWGEVRRLQKESEIFAGQIIEQDEELEALRSTVEERDARIASLEKDMLALKRKASSHTRSADRVEDLQAELHEIQEASESQRAELRDMRKQLRETKANENEMMDLRAELAQAQYALEGVKSKAGSSARDDAVMRRELEILRMEKQEVEVKLGQKLETMKRLQEQAVQEAERKLKERDAKIEELKGDDKVVVLEGEIKKLSKDLFEKSEMLEDAQISNKELKVMLNDQSKAEELAKQEEEKQKLAEQVNKMREELDELSSDRTNIGAIKEQLGFALKERAEIEQRVGDAYERKLSLMNLNKDVTIDSLRKELIEAKAVSSEYNEDVVKHIESLEMENTDVKDELEAKLQLKNTKIHALEHTLGAQEQLVENMRAEMDQLQSSMERTSLNRRAEIEEMQQEMIDTSSKAQRQDREITSLKMTLEDCRLEHKSELYKLKDQIRAMEEDASPKVVEQAAPKKVDVRLDDVKERLENLKWRNTSLQEENLKLRTRLERVEGEVSINRSDQDKVSAMEHEVAVLRNRVREFEEKAQRAATAQSQVPKPSSNEKGGSRFSRGGSTRNAAHAPRSSTKVPDSPKRAQASPLRFLKRRSSQKDADDAKATADDNSSSASKMTF